MNRRRLMHALTATALAAAFATPAHAQGKDKVVLMLNWYVVHRRAKRLPPVAQAFKGFLLKDGAKLIEQALGTKATRRKAA